MYIFNVILEAKLCCFHLRGEKAGNQGKNGLKETSGGLIGLRIQTPVMGGLTSQLGQVAQGCVLWFQIVPQRFYLPGSLALFQRLTALIVKDFLPYIQTNLSEFLFLPRVH